jgi:alpha-tubulin suppressor-like RCC1 family protein
MEHACYVTTGGEIWCWGRNTSGELGDGTQTNSTTPVQVRWANGTAVTGAVSVAAGQAFTCAKMTGGEVYCWGIDTAYNARTSPVRVVLRLPNSQSMDFTITGHITAGYRHACAIESSAGQTVCWGANSLGQLGDNTTNSRDTAVTVGASGIGRIAAGATHSCTIDGATGTSLTCWGQTLFGNGGGLTTLLYPQTSGRVSTYYNNSTVVTAVTAGDRYTCALLAVSGDIQCWGIGGAGQIGNNSTLDVLSPTSTSAGTIFWTP